MICRQIRLTGIPSWLFCNIIADGLSVFWCNACESSHTIHSPNRHTYCTVGAHRHNCECQYTPLCGLMCPEKKKHLDTKVLFALFSNNTVYNPKRTGDLKLATAVDDFLFQSKSNVLKIAALHAGWISQRLNCMKCHFLVNCRKSFFLSQHFAFNQKGKSTVTAATNAALSCHMRWDACP